VQIDINDAKNQLTELGEKVWRGESVVITKSGKPYLDLTLNRVDKITRKPGRLKGQIIMSDDFDETPEELIALFEGKM